MSAPCFRCGRQETREVEFSAYGVPVATRHICSACFSGDMRGANLWSAEFARLLARGVSRADANAQLIARMDAGEEPPELLS